MQIRLKLGLLLMTNMKSHIGFPLTPRSMTLDDLELLWGQILLEFRDIYRVSEVITAKRMKIDRIVSDGIVAH